MLSNNDAKLEIISQYPFLQKNVEVSMFLRDPNNKIPVTPELLNRISTNPKEILEYMEKVIWSITSTYFGGELYFNTQIIKRENDIFLMIDFKETKYKRFYGSTSTRLGVNLQPVMKNSIYNRYEIYFEELNSFIIRFVDELKMNGKSAGYEFNLRKEFPRIYFVLPDVIGVDVHDTEVNQPKIRDNSRYVQYVDSIRQQIKNEYPTILFGDLGKIMGLIVNEQRWRNMSNDERDFYAILYNEYQNKIEQQSKGEYITPYDFLTEIIRKASRSQR